MIDFRSGGVRYQVPCQIHAGSHSGPPGKGDVG